jgi:cytochrome c oxidase subunit IV
MSLTHSNDVPAPVADDVGPDAPHGVHAVPRRVLGGVYGILIFCTVITVAVSRIDLGQANIWVALGIALVKGGLVLMYFMHLRWDSPFNGLVILAALFFVALFIGLALLDSTSYQPQLKPTPMAVQNR